MFEVLRCLGYRWAQFTDGHDLPLGLSFGRILGIGTTVILLLLCLNLFI